MKAVAEDAARESSRNFFLTPLIVIRSVTNWLYFRQNNHWFFKDVLTRRNRATIGFMGFHKVHPTIFRQ